MGNEGLKERLAEQQRQAGTEGIQVAEAKPISRVDELRDLIERMAPEVSKALPNMGLTPDRLGRLMVTLLRTTPDLAACTTQSVLAAFMQMASLGLEPGILGYCYVLPFDNRRKVPGEGWTTVKEAEFVIGYKGELELVRRSGQVKMVYAKIVHAKDTFTYHWGLHPDLVHVPAEGDRGDAIGAYMVAHYTNGGYHFDYMTRAEIEAVRDAHAKGYLKNGEPNPKSPWVAEWATMWLKTTIRQNFKWLPVSSEIALMAAQDETAKTLPADARAEDIKMLLALPDEGTVTAEQVAALPEPDITVDASAESAPVEAPQAPGSPEPPAGGATPAKKGRKAKAKPEGCQEFPFFLRSCNSTHGKLAADITDADLKAMKCDVCGLAAAACWAFSKDAPDAEQSALPVD